LILVRARDFETNWQRQLLLERCDVTMSGPQFELRVSVRSQSGEIIVAAREQVDAGECLRVAAVEPFGQPHNRREYPNGSAQAAIEVPVSLVGFLRRRLSMVSRDQRDDLDFLRIEAAQISILDQVVGMTVMTIVTDVYADIVKECRDLEPFSLAVAKAVDAARLVKNAERQARDLLRMI